MNNIIAVVVTYNPNDKLYRNISSYINQVDKVVIVDNGSLEEYKTNFKNIEDNEKIEVVYNDRNLGIATALNQGVSLAKKLNAKYLITFDQDSFATEDMLQQLLLSYSQLSNKGVMVGFVGPIFTEEKYASSINQMDKELNVEEVETLITSGSFCDISLFEEVGLFKDEFFIDYVDHEYCLNAKTKGYRHFQDRNAQLLHNLGNTKKYRLLKGITITSSNHSSLRRYYMFRNRLYVYKKYFRKFPKWILNDLLLAVKEITKMILVEEDKKKKLKSVLMGMGDFMKSRAGEMNHK